MSQPDGGLQRVRRFVIQQPIVQETIHFLREVGAGGCEGFVLWGGTRQSEDTFRFTSIVIPEQRALMTPNGLLVIVDGEALFRVNKTFHERREILGGQVHTHPTSAYHSSTDNHYPLVTLLGGLSIVLPDFAKNAPEDMRVWAWYRLAGYGHWRLALDDTEVIFE
jgi:hypothetical protein